jgi:hypothetical protein
MKPPLARGGFYHGANIAPTGQTAAHAPHSTHSSGEITYFESPSEIAATGQVPAQEPQEMQSSLIVYAMVNHTSFLIVATTTNLKAPSSCCFCLTT